MRVVLGFCLDLVDLFWNRDERTRTKGNGQQRDGSTKRCCGLSAAEKEKMPFAREGFGLLASLQVWSGFV